MPILSHVTSHERSVLTQVRKQVDQACHREWIAAQASDRVEIEDAPCKNDRFTTVEDDGSCLRCGVEQGERCR